MAEEEVGSQAEAGGGEGSSPRRFRARRVVDMGFGWPDELQERVIELAAGEEPPAGAVEVEAETPLDEEWRRVGFATPGSDEIEGLPVVQREGA